MPISKKGLWPILLTGMALGTAWAIRGQFGHVQGAAWAGAIGTLALLLLAKRNDWYPIAIKATLAGALGWGIGGIISYGIVVGYGRGVDFANVYYGLAMLFVIGGLFGLLGGGFTGLVLSDTTSKPVNWPIFFSVSIASAVLGYYLLIIEFGWLMTPPRSEHWAACVGLGAALIWYCVKYKYSSALRVALLSGFGSGFGFAFGNFLQVMGNVSGFQFNFWNVMEYSIGFFGGIAMAYGVFTSEWELQKPATPRASNRIPLILVALVIPFIVWEQSFSLERIMRIYATFMDVTVSHWPTTTLWIGLGMVVVFGTFWINYFYGNTQTEFTYKNLRLFFSSLFGLYVVFSWLITGAYLSTYSIEQYLYVLNYGVIIWQLDKVAPVLTIRQTNYRKFALNFALLLGVLSVLVLIAINSHGELKGAHNRF